MDAPSLSRSRSLADVELVGEVHSENSPSTADSPDHKDWGGCEEDDGLRFFKGCLYAVIPSALLWWGIFELASLVTS